MANNKGNILLLILLTSVFIFGFSTSTIAQVYQKGNINIGFEGGVQFTNVSDAYTINIPTSGVGYSLGPFVEYHVSPAFKLRFALNYDNRKFGISEPPYRVNDSSGNFEYSYFQFNRDYNVNYLTIPLSVFYVKGNEKFKIYIQFSFYYSLYLNAHQKGTNDLYIDPLDYPFVTDSTITVGHNIKAFDEPVEGLFSSSDFGINFYLGGIIKLSPRFGLTIAPGFTVGMANVYEDPSRRSKWSRIFKINTGIVYTLKKK